MLTKVDHVGYVARERAAGVAALGNAYGLGPAVEFELPQFSLRGAFLEAANALVEVVEFTDPALARRRLDGQQLRLDHVAYEVADIERAADHLRALGARFCAPDGSELELPLELAGARHLWTIPGTAPGICVQLIERP